MQKPASDSLPFPAPWRRLGYGVLGLGVIWLAACGGPKEVVVLLPEFDAKGSAVTITGGAQPVTLDTPLASAKITARGQITQEIATDQEVRERFSQALAAEPPPPKSFVLQFEMGTTTLQTASQDELKKLLEEVAKRQAVEVQITGHTDRVGSVEDNDQLSLKRAEAVLDILRENGLKASFVRVVGRGEREPAVQTPDEQEEAQNRRVEIIVR